jgi:hypothetical protein
VCAFLQGKAHEVQGTHETTQEIGEVGHPASAAGERQKQTFDGVMGLRPVFLNPRTLVRTWGTRQALM